MQETNIQGDSEQEHPAWQIVRWVGVWVTLFLMLGVFGGLFTSGPKDIPAGMAWVNGVSASSSTFYILRGGQHLILELNPHSQRLMAALFTGFAVMFMYIFSQGLHGKLKNRQKDTLPPWQQGLGMAVAVAAIVFLLWYGVGNLLKKERLDFDPAGDTVQLNGDYIGSFRRVTGFRSYVTHGSKGSINYHLVLEIAGQGERQIGGGNPHDDVDVMAAYLNAYLAEVRQASQ